MLLPSLYSIRLRSRALKRSQPSTGAPALSAPCSRTLAASTLKCARVAARFRAQARRVTSGIMASSACPGGDGGAQKAFDAQFVHLNQRVSLTNTPSTALSRTNCGRFLCASNVRRSISAGAVRSSCDGYNGEAFRCRDGASQADTAARRNDINSSHGAIICEFDGASPQSDVLGTVLSNMNSLYHVVGESVEEGHVSNAQMLRVTPPFEENGTLVPTHVSSPLAQAIPTGFTATSPSSASWCKVESCCTPSPLAPTYEPPKYEALLPHFSCAITFKSHVRQHWRR